MLAHYAADVQESVDDELAWDLQALEAARQVSDSRAKRYHPSLVIEKFFPSLHLNLAEAYRKLGELEHARQHLAAARNTLAALPHDEYGQNIRAGIDRSAELVEGPSAAQS